MKIFITIMLIVIGQTNAFAENPKSGLCDSNQSVIFNCPTKQQKWISVCATTNPAEIQYRFGMSKKIELQLPTKTDKKPTFNYVSYSGGGGAYTRFTTNSTDYIVYSRIVKGEGDSSGLLVLQKNKKAIWIRCAKQSVLDAPTLEKLQILQEERGIDPLVDNLE